MVGNVMRTVSVDSLHSMHERSRELTHIFLFQWKTCFRFINAACLSISRKSLATDAMPLNFTKNIPQNGVL